MPVVTDFPAKHQQTAVIHHPGRGLVPQSIGELQTLSEYLAASDIIPNEFKGKPANCAVAIMAGQSIGLDPFQSMKSLAVINGRPSLWGDALIALVLASPLCEQVTMYYDSQAKSGVCRAKRRGQPMTETRFSMDQANAAGLLNNPKKIPWKHYPERMCQLRARALALRDNFADLLMGLQVRELDINDCPPLAEPEPVPAAVVDTETGEIIDMEPEPENPEPADNKADWFKKNTAEMIQAATTIDELDEIAQLIRDQEPDQVTREYLLQRWTDQKKQVVADNTP